MKCIGCCLSSKEILVEMEHVKAHRNSEGQKEDVAFREFFLEVRRKRTSWPKKERCVMNDLWRRQGRVLCSKREREKCT